MWLSYIMMRKSREVQSSGWRNGTVEDLAVSSGVRVFMGHRKVSLSQVSVPDDK